MVLVDESKAERSPQNPSWWSDTHFCRALNCPPDQSDLGGAPSPVSPWRSQTAMMTGSLKPCRVRFLHSEPKRLQEEIKRDPSLEANDSCPGWPHLEHHSKTLGRDSGYRLVPRQDAHTDRLQTSAPAQMEKSPSPSFARGKPPCQHLAIPLPHTHVLWPLPSSSSSMFLIIYSL